MADISKEIRAFREASYGKHVRGAMIALAEKVNADGEQALADVAEQVDNIQEALRISNDAVIISRDAVKRADDTLSRADDVLLDATHLADESAESAVISKSWSGGGTGKRPGEDTDNSRYHSRQSKIHADTSGSEADRAAVEADRAARYADIVAPGFFVDLESMSLYMKAGVGVDFGIFDDNILCWQIT